MKTTAKTLYLTAFAGFIEFGRKNGNPAAQEQLDALESKAEILPIEWYENLTGEIPKHKFASYSDVAAGREIAKRIMQA